MKMAKPRILAVVVLMALGIGPAARAGWFSREPEAPKGDAAPRAQHKYVLNVPDKKTEQELMSMLAGRKALEEDVAVLRRLLQFKITVYGSIQKALSEEYGISKGMKWNYQSDSMTIVEVASTNGAANQASSTNALFRKTLTDKAQEEKLLRMRRDSGRTGEQIMVIQDLLKEQDSTLKRQMGLMASKFSLKPDKMYYYDRKTMTLYEVINPPGTARKQVPRRQ